MIKNTVAACEKSGMPIEHANRFQHVANITNNIIASRSVGKWATGLIRESYASKGFHVKAKSCNWGPMAGFVLADPRFSKKGCDAGAVNSQSRAITQATQHGANTTPLYISDARRQALAGGLNCMTEVSRNSPTSITYQASAPGGPMMKFNLIKDDQGPRDAWRVCYHQDVTPTSPVYNGVTNHGQNPPVLALTNPGTSARNYKSALTGDYDLWGVYPPSADYNPYGKDGRMVPMSNYSARPIREFIESEDEDIGNITIRVNQIRQMLNKEINAAGYRGGDMVHHSDELGRPLVDEVELEFIAFFPNQDGRARFIETMGDFQVFEIQVRNAGFKDLYNPNWTQFHRYNNVLDQINSGRALRGASEGYNW